MRSAKETGCFPYCKHLYPSHLKKCPWCDLEKTKYPVVTPPVYTPPVNNNPTTNIPKTSTTVPTYSSQLKSDGVMASSGMFWFLTLAITLGGQALIHGITGGRLAAEIFGSSYGSGIESWGMNLAKWLGPWGFIICGLVGTILYNTMNRKGKLYGYRWYHYLLSCVVSFACSAAWILVVLVISIAIIIIAIIVIVAIIIGIFSGS